MRSWQQYVVLLGLALGATLPSATAGPVTSLPYDEFETVVRRCVARIPDLQALWQWRAKDDRPVYFGGGALRGLLRWLVPELARRPASEVCQAGAPSIDELVSVGADRDLFDDEHDFTWYRANFPDYANWDVLTREFYESSVLAGGPTLEKARVNPDRIDDPLGGLRDFHQGIVRYHDAPESVFRDFRGVDQGIIKANTKAALVLRTLRFWLDLPMTAISETSWEKMRAAIAYETGEGLLQPDSYFVRKALQRLYQASGYEVSRVSELLHRVGLLVPLAKLGYELDREGFPEAALIDSERADHLDATTVAELKLSARRFPTAIAAMRVEAMRATTAAEFVRAFYHRKKSLGIDYRRAIHHLALELAPRFAALVPTFDDVRAMVEHAISIDVNVAYVRAFAERNAADPDARERCARLLVARE